MNKYFPLHVQVYEAVKMDVDDLTAQQAAMEMTHLTINPESIRNLKDGWTTCVMLGIILLFP